MRIDTEVRQQFPGFPASRDSANGQFVAANPLPAPRGTILDANGTILVESRQLVKLSIAPREVAAPLPKKDDGIKRMDILTRGLARAGVSQEWVRKARDTSHAWIDLPGRYLATDVALNGQSKLAHRRSKHCARRFG